MRRKTNEEFLQELKDKQIIYIPLEEYKTYSTKIKWKCPKCENVFEASPSNIFQGKGCPYCGKHGYTVLVGFNDMWTTNPKLAKQLLNPDDGYKYKQYSNAYTDWICPVCGSIVRNKRINYVAENGVSCPNCSNGVSYPEKFIANMLKQLGIDYKHDCQLCWSDKKRYDFYIEDLSLIIETHGKQHYTDSFVRLGGITVDEQKRIDKLKESTAINNGVVNYIQLDCSVSNMEYIRNSITNSRLGDILDLASVNWDECNTYAVNNYNIKNACDAWYNTHDTEAVAEIIHASRATAIEYLKQGAKLGMCDYDVKKSLNVKAAICVETQKIYSPIGDCIKDGFDRTCVCSCCKGKQKTHKGCHFEYYEEVG